MFFLVTALTQPGLDFSFLCAATIKAMTLSVFGPKRTAVVVRSRTAGAASLPVKRASARASGCSAMAPLSNMWNAAISRRSRPVRCWSRRASRRTWFRAIFEISTRRTGISAKDLQRIMGFGSYETASR